MRRRPTVCGSSKAVPPFFGRQIRGGFKKQPDLRHLTMLAGQKVTVSECPKVLRKILHKVFQGIHVAKSAVAGTAAHVFNKALADSNQALLRLVSVGVQAVKCFAAHERLQLVLKPLGSQDEIVICDAPAAFVSA